MKRKPYWEMTDQELADATKVYDEPLDDDASRPLTTAEKQHWQNVKRKRGRPKQGQGFERITVSMERGLLRQVTALAKKHHLTRSKLFAVVLKQALAQVQKT